MKKKKRRKKYQEEGSFQVSRSDDLLTNKEKSEREITTVSIIFENPFSANGELVTTAVSLISIAFTGLCRC